MKYFKNTSWLLAEKILRIIVGLFVGVWVARYLGPEQFGLFSYAQSFVVLFATFSRLGLDGIIVRELVKSENKKHALIGTAFWLKVMGAIVTIVMLAIAVIFTSNNSYTNTLIFIIASGTIFQSFNVIDFYFQSKVLSKYVVYANIISLFITTVIKIILILNEAPLIAFAWVILFDNIVLALGFVYFFHKNSTINIKKLKFNKTIAVTLLRDSWPLILNGIIVALYFKIDQIMINEILGNYENGQYAAATMISEAWYFFPQIILISFFPALVKAKKNNQKSYTKGLGYLFSMLTWVSLSIALIVAYFSKEIILLLYGEAFIHASDVLTIHVFAGIVMSLGLVTGRYLTIENKTIKSFYRNFFGTTANITLNYFLIPVYGLIGAAYATIISQIMANYLYDIFDRDLHQLFILKNKSFFNLNLLSNILGKIF